MPKAVDLSNPSEAVPSPAPPPFPLLAYVDSLMESLRRHVPKALGEWDEEAIHQARVATRRLKAALDLMRPALGNKRRKPLARVLRKLRRRLGPLRDAEVMLDHLRELAGLPKCAEAANWLGDHVGLQRVALRDASGREALSAEVLGQLDAWGPVRQAIARAGDAAGPLLSDSVHRQLGAFADQADRLAGRRAGDADARAEQQNPHDLRIAGKALRYTLEMALVQGYAVPRKVMGTFKRMQELLGAWHDFVVLTDQAMRSSLDAQLGHHDTARQEQVLDLARFANRRAGHHLDAFARLWTSKGVEVAAAIRAAVPHPSAPPAGGGGVSESQTDPGPNGSAGSGGPAASPPASPSAVS